MFTRSFLQLLTLSLLSLPLHVAYGQVVDEAIAVPGLTQDLQSSAINQVPEDFSYYGNRQVTPLPAASIDGYLTLADVIASTLTSFPMVQEARLQQTVARGNQISSRGAYDTKLQMESLSEPTGFYRNYRNGLGLSRQTWWGGYLSAGYRIGRGEFQPWYKERETNEAGEFKLALGMPLLQGRAIDAERVGVFQANLQQMAAQPQVQAALLEASQEAAEFYWNWVAAGQKLIAERTLLDLAQTRQSKFEAGEAAGKFAEIDVVLNRQLVAERTSKLLAARQKYRDSEFKLSLFIRDNSSQPMVPGRDWLPESFPIVQALPPSNYNDDLAAALLRRPEIQLIRLSVRKNQLDRQLAQNQLLPNLDLVAEGSQDVGRRASSSNDKGRFQVLVGIQGELPIQRRKARGKILAQNGKISQLQQKLQLQQEKIGVELQMAHNALSIANEIVLQSEIARATALDSFGRYSIAFQKGYADLIYLNLLETKANESELKLIEAKRNWFVALAQMQSALGLDPLDQAIRVSELPPGTPANDASAVNQAPEDFDADWKLHKGANP